MDLLVKMDLTILDAIADKFHSPVLDFLMPLISSLVNYGLIWILLGAGLLLVPKERKTGGKILLALLFSLLLCNLILKNVFVRVRPFTLVEEISLLVEAPTDWSFPSGHTSASFAVATLLLREGKKGGWAALVLALLVAFSRLYLYVHYPSDVLVGALVGIGSGLLSYWLWPRLEKVCRKGGRAA